MVNFISKNAKKRKLQNTLPFYDKIGTKFCSKITAENNTLKYSLGK